MLSVLHGMVDVGRTSVDDSVTASFAFRNNSANGLSLTFLPKCDCTTVSAESVELGPHKRGSIEVKVAVESPEEFTKYVYVQAAGGDVFFSVAIKGRGK